MYRTEWTTKFVSIRPEAWQRLVGPETSPFLEWTWLAALEQAGCAVPQEGWQPFHLTVYRGQQLVGAAPLYIKSHSYGEFVFDQSWAELAQRLRVRYYPKLVAMVPFTPATGYRFLMDPEEDPDSLLDVMLTAIDQLCEKQKLACWNVLYPALDFQERLLARGFLPRLGHNYQWQNEGFGTFEDFLDRFKSSQRRNIRRECKALVDLGLEFKVYTGDTIPPGMYSFMYDLYADTCAKFMNWSKYLNRTFFKLLEDDFRENTVFISGEYQGKSVGMSFCIRKGDRMYGRYWGCTQEIKNLHFSACYYEPVRFAIDHGLQRFDPGAGGSFKMRRGFPATPTYSLHRIYNPRLRTVLEDHLPKANAYHQLEIEDLNTNAPLKEISEGAPEETTHPLSPTE
ncbi:GNAT family N-acetyltransferase [Candidatus Cyanaurora vandensis]|uniref:GNAT family N-acetyltransferase n=1 Tax=Candidatus Cyanaurora vandensis TaxID=2714958 RepID=UPI00257C3991|nr:GNAT family N-acetyltransferase [Candidatus Cyanaurora vandensis]